MYVEITQDELMILDLFKNAERVEFTRFRDGIEIGKAYVEQFGEPSYASKDNTEWYKAVRDIDGVTVQVISFLEKEGIVEKGEQ